MLRNTRCHGKGLAPRCPGHYQLAAFLIARQVILNAEPESVVWHLSKIGSVDTCSQAKKGICSPAFLEEVVIILASENCVQIEGGSSAATHFSGGL